jgi:hypothetical protein
MTPDSATEISLDAHENIGYRLDAKIWLAELCTTNNYIEPRIINDRTYAAIMPLIYTHAIITGRIGDDACYDDRWCYHGREAAIAALRAWDGTGEPDGWHRHPGTGRRRDSAEVEYFSP